MYRTVISQNYSDPAHKMIDNNRYGKGTVSYTHLRAHET